MIRTLVATIILIFIASVSYAQKAPNNMHGEAGAIKGAVPGFAKKPKYFNAKLAEENLRYLYDEKSVRLVISLDHCSDVGKVIRKINVNFKSDPIEHLCRKIYRKNYNKNISLFEEVASAIGSINFYIHCRYGAHRAVTTLTGAWIARQRLPFEEAFEKAGGKKRAFRSKGQKELIGQAKRYAREKAAFSGCSEEDL